MQIVGHIILRNDTFISIFGRIYRPWQSTQRMAVEFQQ